MSLALESVAETNRFEFDSDSVINWNDRPCLEHKSREHRAELMDCRRIVTVQQHIPAPVTHADYEQFDFEIAGRLPLRENLEDPLLRIFVLHRRTLRTFCPREHVLQRRSPCLG